MDISKPYLVVEFPDGVQLVASNWMSENNEFCHWPNFTSNIRYDNAVKNLEDVDLSWQKFPIRSIIAATGKFVLFNLKY